MTLELGFEPADVARPGYQLASFKEAALPIYLLTARVVTRERRPLNPLEEGCVRAIDAGLYSVDDLTAFLGLQRIVMNSLLASLSSQEIINYSKALDGGEAMVSLTDKGNAAAKDLSLVTPQERIVKLAYDPILKRVVFIQPAALWKPREVRLAGRLEVPLCGAKRPEVDDVPLLDIDRALERMRRSEGETSELLALRRIERREMHFMPCMALFYKSNSGTDVVVAFLRDGTFAIEHENAFRELGGVDQIGANAVLALPEELPTPEADVQLDAPSEPRNATVVASTLRSIRCHEHPPLLRDALENSQQRLLIVSPWIRDQVVEKHSFIKPLERLLRRGVHVYIGYGISENDGEKRDRAAGKPSITRQAKEALDALKAMHANFHFQCIGNTHRKALVCDGRFAVTTSFNWLSFKGDPKAPPRDESGTLITKAEYVEQVFNDCLRLIEDGYDHPK